MIVAEASFLHSLEVNGKNTLTERRDRRDWTMDNKKNDERDVQCMLESGREGRKIHLLTIIGEVEGHENLPSNNKSTKYETVLPTLASMEEDEKVSGVLVLINTVGGDVESGLAIAEMIASMSKPTVSLVLGGSHSIGVPLAVSTDYSFIVPSATMMIHPVRVNGLVIGVNQTYRMMERTQERIIQFVEEHSRIQPGRMEKLMLDTSQMVKDVGTILGGREAVEEGLINEVGGISEAVAKLHELMELHQEEKNRECGRK